MVQKLLKVVLLGCFLTLVSVPAMAQEAMEEEELNFQYAYGTIQEITTDKMVLLEYDFESEKEVEVSYLMDADIVFENFNSIADIKVGDDVDVAFLEENGQKVAALIAIDDSEQDEQDLGTDSMDSPGQE